MIHQLSFNPEEHHQPRTCPERRLLEAVLYRAYQDMFATAKDQYLAHDKRGRKDLTREELDTPRITSQRRAALWFLSDEEESDECFPFLYIVLMLDISDTMVSILRKVAVKVVESCDALMPVGSVPGAAKVSYGLVSRRKDYT